MADDCSPIQGIDAVRLIPGDPDLIEVALTSEAGPFRFHLTRHQASELGPQVFVAATADADSFRALPVDGESHHLFPDGSLYLGLRLLQGGVLQVLISAEATKSLAAALSGRRGH
jgi:hypothetical protein